MLEAWVARLHARLTPTTYRYLVYVATSAAAVVVAVVSVAVLSLYFDQPFLDVAVVALVAAVAVSVSVGTASWRARGAFTALERWRRNAYPTPRETIEVWELATSFYVRQYRRDSWWVGLGIVVPVLGVTAWRWGLGPAQLGAVLLAAMVPSFYGTVLSFSVGEVLLRPVVAEMAEALPDQFEFHPAGVLLATRLRLALPTYTTMTGLTATGLLGETNGAGRLALTVLVSLGVGLFFSLELTNLLVMSVIRPIVDVRTRLARVREGDYATRARIVGRDELGELAHDFNLMARGLAERETMREAFGTYVDRDVVELILSDELALEGSEAEVSVLFVDVRSFTAYAERASATEVVASLNTLFGEMVPVVESYGGHIDKFLGDGLMAVFGAPVPQADHADRAVAAARMIVDVIGLGASGLRVGAGVNSGRVVAGPLGGAGRLNFSVIGDVVNVAARVEAATRETGDDVLVTAATRDLMRWPEILVARGPVALKGKSEPVEVFTLVRADP